MSEITSKIIESLIEKRIINGEICYYCKYKSCSLGCVSHELIKSHIKQHFFGLKARLNHNQDFDETDDSIDSEENVVISNVESIAHINSRVINKRFKCFSPECRLEFNTKSELKLHELRSHCNKKDFNVIHVNTGHTSNPFSNELMLFTEYLNFKNKRKSENITNHSNDVNVKVMKSTLQKKLNQNIRYNTNYGFNTVCNNSNNDNKVSKISADYFEILNKNKEKRNKSRNDIKKYRQK